MAKKTIRILVSPLSGTFTLFRASVDGKTELETNGSSKQVVTKAAKTKIEVEAEGTSGSVLHCRIRIRYDVSESEVTIVADREMDQSGNVKMVFEV